MLPEVATLRGDGLTRSLSSDAAERFFTLGFALEQMHLNFKNLEQCMAECGLERPSRQVATPDV
jgi:hypothetical protein